MAATCGSAITTQTKRQACSGPSRVGRERKPVCWSLAIDLKSFRVMTSYAAVLHSAAATIRSPDKACSLTAVPTDHASPSQGTPDARLLHQPLA